MLYSKTQLLGTLGLFQLLMQPVFAAERTDIEAFECTFEETLIRVFKSKINNLNAKVAWDMYRANGLRKDEFKTNDGRLVRGIVWEAVEPRGYLLIAQGTSMLAAEIYEHFREYSRLGLDVYIYDFRGYGMSGGNTSLRALIADYGQRISELNKKPAYRFRFLYGLSLGGIIFTNALKPAKLDYSALILDSTPHAIPWYALCPSWLDPIDNIPEYCANWLVIAGLADKQIGSRGRKLLRSAKESCGAVTNEEESFGHIFTDNRENTKQRLQTAKEFLVQIMGRRKDENE